MVVASLDRSLFEIILGDCRLCVKASTKKYRWLYLVIRQHDVTVFCTILNRPLLKKSYK